MATKEERIKEKNRRLLEKAMRIPLNDTILQVQRGVINIADLHARIDQKIKEGQVNG